MEAVVQRQRTTLSTKKSRVTGTSEATAGGSSLAGWSVTGVRTHAAAGMLSERLSKVSYRTGLCKKRLHRGTELQLVTVHKNKPNLTQDEHVASGVRSELVEWGQSHPLSQAPC